MGSVNKSLPIAVRLLKHLLEYQNVLNTCRKENVQLKEANEKLTESCNSLKIETEKISAEAQKANNCLPSSYVM